MFYWKYWSIYLGVFYEKAVLKNFAKFLQILENICVKDQYHISWHRSGVFISDFEYMKHDS